MPKNQSTVAKKARAVQREAGGKHTALLAEQAVCGKRLDPWHQYPGTCARAPHPDQEPCSPDRDFDAVAWRKKAADAWAKEQARWDALTPEEQAEEERLVQEEAYGDGDEEPSDWIEYQED